jgi:hypothetical protein
MTITVPKDVAKVPDSKATWESFVPEEPTGKTEYANNFFVLQQTKSPIALNGVDSIKYRIIMQQTSAVLKKSKVQAIQGGDGSKLIGKDLVIAESFEEFRILMDWDKLENYLFAMLTVINQHHEASKNANRKIPWNEFIDTLIAIGEKRLKTPMSPLALAPKSGASDETPTIDIAISQHLSKQEDCINTVDDATDALRELLEKVKIIRNILKKLNAGAVNNATLRIQLGRDYKAAKELDRKIAAFLNYNTRRSSKMIAPIQVMMRLQNQHQELSNCLNKELKSDKHIQDISNTETDRQRRTRSVDVYEIKSKRRAQRSIDFDNNGVHFAFDNSEEDDANSKARYEPQKQVQVDPNAVQISLEQVSQIEVEKLIARETKDDLKEIESDFHTLHLMHEDMHALIGEQVEALKSISKNLDSSRQSVRVGNQNVRDSRKMMLNNIL